MNHLKFYADKSKLQLGSEISQKGKPIAFYNRKLNPTQVNYTTIGDEILSIVKFPKECKNILLRQQIKVFIDHKNLMY